MTRDETETFLLETLKGWDFRWMVMLDEEWDAKSSDMLKSAVL